jgi:4-hydroxybenzoate polyprenyltransferase
MGLLRFLASSNLFISAVAGSVVWGAFGYFGLEPDWHLIGFTFFATLFTYNFQRRVGNLHVSNAFSRVERLLMLAGFTGMLAFVMKLRLHQIIFLALAGALSIGYAYPFFKYQGKKLSLREVPYLKLWLILIVWSISTVLVPLYQRIEPAELLLFSLQQFLFVLGLTIPFDIRDLRWDSPQLHTIPQVFGLRKARYLAMTSLALALIPAYLLLWRGSSEGSLFYVFAGTVSAGIFLVSQTRKDRGELFFALLLDGVLLLQGILFAIS